MARGAIKVQWLAISKIASVTHCRLALAECTGRASYAISSNLCSNLQHTQTCACWSASVLVRLRFNECHSHNTHWGKVMSTSRLLYKVMPTSCLGAVTCRQSKHSHIQERHAGTGSRVRNWAPHAHLQHFSLKEKKRGKDNPKPLASLCTHLPGAHCSSC
jgi:hypothetical protein